MLSAMRTFRQQLDSGKVCIGCGISTSDPSMTESLAELFDFLWIDLEHTALTFESLQAHLIAGRATATPPWCGCRAARLRGSRSVSTPALAA